MNKKGRKMSHRPPLYYRFLIAVLSVFYRLFVWQRSKKYDTRGRELNERFGQFYQPAPTNQKGVIWCHAVSLGELNTVSILLQKLMQEGYAIWITSTTQTGFWRAEQLFAQQISESKVAHSFLPIDKADVVDKFLQHTCPVAVLFVETELWATTLYRLNQKNIPSLMVNARLTQKSFEGYRKFSNLSYGMMKNLQKIIVQNQASLQRFLALGADASQLVLADSLKWSSSTDLTQEQQDLIDIFDHQLKTIKKKAWVAASTHDGEETLMLLVQKQLINHQDAVLILVPRHPQRFESVYQMCTKMGLRTARRSLGQDIHQDTQVYLADSLGELMAWYKVGCVAVVGGSFVPVGGHNPVEPASVGTPIIIGRHDTNCYELVDDLIASKSAYRLDCDVQNEENLKISVMKLHQVLLDFLNDENKTKQMGLAAQKLVQQKRHAADHQFHEILAVMNHKNNDKNNRKDNDKR